MPTVPDPEFESTIHAAVRRRHAKLLEDLVRLRDDAGISRRALARASGVDRRYLDRIETGEVSPSIETYQRLASALGADLSTRIYANTGPAIRDRWAAPMLEHVLATRHQRWDPYPEASVTRPVRGWIDLVLHEPRDDVLLANELQSELRRLEQQIRWHASKAQALPSWEGFAHLGDEPRISQLLVVRRTRATRAVASEFRRQLRVAYPAHPDDAVAALTGKEPWPGAALVWMAVEGAKANWVSGR
jgi:transcriptional regulator with XRE-family HTH domain